ncbi:MAG: hypothetical protein ACXVPU_16410 [Bacteroidia bacterium]
MRTVQFNVHTEVITEFVEAMTSRNLSNSVEGTTEEGEIIIEIEYEKKESDEVDELEEILEKLTDEIEEGEED